MLHWAFWNFQFFSPFHYVSLRYVFSCVHFFAPELVSVYFLVTSLSGPVLTKNTAKSRRLSVHRAIKEYRTLELYK